VNKFGLFLAHCAFRVPNLVDSLVAQTAAHPKVARRRPDAISYGSPEDGLGVHAFDGARPILQFYGRFGLLELAPNTLTQSASVKISS